ncbi:MAG: class B sortase, partial [Oscillospiraceae bacterium]|nr:class B sortase [Oscillospiraceae bacterium]
MRRKGKRSRTIVWLLLALSLCAMAVSGYKLGDIRQADQAGRQSYAELAGRAHPAGLPVPDMGIDFAALQAVNPDTAAWLYSPGTAIDYPVMRAREYDYYLRHLPDGAYNKNGTLFIDYNCA